MSDNNDLKRNREIFEQLIGLEKATGEAREPRRESFSPPYSEAARAGAPPTSYEPLRQTTEVFSLERGASQGRDAAMAPPLSRPVGIEFPELSKSAAAPPDNTLENFYHKLETEARRTSQLISEEEQA